MNRVGDSLYHFGGNELLVQALASAGVEFVVIGGLAVAWYCADRQADDMDLLVNPTPENSRRLAMALTGLGLHGFSDHSFMRLGLQVPLKGQFYAELLTPTADAPSFSETYAEAERGKLFGIWVWIASRSSLIHMKKAAAASAQAQLEKHLEDIQRLSNAA
jgi:hypothetical protein